MLLLVLLIIHQAIAFPAYWFSRSACHPEIGNTVMGMTVTKDSQNRFGLSISEGLHKGVINSYVPLATYTVSLNFFSSAAHYLVTATAGNLSVDDPTVTRPQAGQLAACANALSGAIAATQAVKSAIFTWDAPVAGSGPVTISVTTSEGTSTFVVTNDITLQETKEVPPTSSSSGYEILSTNASKLAQLGEPCGGNTLSPSQCAPGLVCQPRPGNNLPFGDVGGICVATNGQQNSDGEGKYNTHPAHSGSKRKFKGGRHSKSHKSAKGKQRSRRRQQEHSPKGKRKGPSPHTWGKIPRRVENHRQQRRH